MTAPLACPQCAAAVRADAAWCPLCFTRLESSFDPLTAPIEEVLGSGGGTATTTMTQPVQETADAVSDTPPEPPREQISDVVAEPFVETSDSEPSDEATPSEISDIDVMLAMLAAEHRQADPSTEMLDRFSDKGTRMVIMVAGTIVIGIVCLGLLAVLGTFW